MAQVETKLPYKVADMSLGRLGPQGNRAGRERNARPDGPAAEIRPAASRWPGPTSPAACT